MGLYPGRMAVTWGLYARISDDRKDGAGVERQLADLRKLAASKGWAVVEFVDSGRSAFKRGGKRPAYAAMLEAARRGEIVGIAAWKADRLHRQPRELEDVIDLAEDSGVAVVTMDGTLDLNSAYGRAAARGAISYAALESGIKSERILAQQAQYRADGRWTTSTIPFGCRTDDKRRLIVDPAEAAIVQDAAERIIRGDSILSVARLMNSAGLVTRTGRPWTHAGVRQLFTRDSAGLVVPAGTLAAVRAVLADPSRRKAAPRSTLLGGIAVCGPCGGRLIGAWANGDPAYKCGRQAVAGHVTIRRDLLDDFVLDVVEARLALPDAVAARTVAGDDDAGETEAAMAALDAEERDARLLLAEGLITAGQFRADLAPGFARRREALEAKLAEAGRKAVPVMPPALVGANVRGLSQEDQRAVIRALVRVAVQPGRSLLKRVEISPA